MALLQQMRKVGSVQEGDQVNIFRAISGKAGANPCLGLDIS